MSFFLSRSQALSWVMALSACCIVPAQADDNWRGSIRAKVQTDNRYSHEGSVFGEAWEQLFYDNDDLDLQGAIDTVQRISSLQRDSREAVYQAYLQKGVAAWASKFKLGRFQRTDNLGFYYLDGLDYQFAPQSGPFSLDVYGGRPGRLDHVLSVEGESLFGLEGAGHFEPRWERAWSPLSLDVWDIRLGYQRFKEAQAVDRINIGSTASGRIGLGEANKYEATVSGTYRADRNALENVWLSGQADLGKSLRLRTSYEEYRPRNPYPTFRERFYTAYVLGEQTLLKGSLHHQAAEGWTYHLGGQRATRERGVDGYGGYAGLSITQWPGLKLSGEVDYLDLGADEAKSLYLSAAHSPSSKWRLQANAALRFEHKQLYGENRAIGGEIEVQYLVQSNLVLSATGTHIWNTRINDEYLAAVQMIYYFDNFKPKTH
ncbi:MAG: hypothetical protein PHE55_15650 [Methylococcaceae bacterium]|nr:hypothetical protein [Methylococcaceae bacterium]